VDKSFKASPKNSVANIGFVEPLPISVLHILCFDLSGPKRAYSPRKATTECGVLGFQTRLTGQPLKVPKADFKNFVET
jgi:hypothetical protein